MGWISVKDKFPEIDNYGFDDNEGISDAVLILYTCKDDDKPKHIFKGIGHYYVTKEKTTWTLYEPLMWDCITKNHEEFLDVTHWMHVPELPDGMD